MARVKRAVNAAKKRRTTLERAEGYRGQRSRLYRKAKEQVTHSLVYSYRDRKARKGDFRRLWIQRINAAARAQGMTYNRFIQGLNLAGVEVDRKILAELAVHDAPAFATLMRLLKTDRCWVKLASLYRLSSEPYPHRDMLPMIERVVAARPDRILWGSNWPHPICPVPMPNDGDLVDLIPLWFPDGRTQHLVLVDNPAELYGFPTPTNN